MFVPEVNRIALLQFIVGGKVTSDVFADLVWAGIGLAQAESYSYSYNPVIGVQRAEWTVSLAIGYTASPLGLD